MSSKTRRSVDLDFRPRSYFWAADHGIALASDIQGAVRRELHQAALADGSDEAVPRFLSVPTLDPDRRRAWSNVHPSCMGGEYLPELDPQEVEIARIVIASTTQDTTCVRARREGDRIRYRIVDEYEGQTLDQKTTLESDLPLTLGALVDFFLQGWNLFEVLDVNFAEHDYPLDEVTGFIVDASSSFYAGFGPELHRRVRLWVRQARARLRETPTNATNGATRS